jgi:hypothetical protein
MIDGSWHTGNAADESGQYRGWLLGHFIDAVPESVRKTEALEIKWGIHPAGLSRNAWTTGEKRWTMVIMVDGRFRVDLSTGSVTLKRQGDYLISGPGIDPLVGGRGGFDGHYRALALDTVGALARIALPLHNRVRATGRHGPEEAGLVTRQEEPQGLERQPRSCPVG